LAFGRAIASLGIVAGTTTSQETQFMQTNIVRLLASLLLVILMAPQAFAQEAEDNQDADKKSFKEHYHMGTMTPPDQQESMDIKYVMSMADGEHKAWIVADVMGESLKVEMMDLEMNEGVVTYSWSPPDSDVVISCELAASDEGGWAGDCIDNEDGDVGQMTMGPMMDYDADHEADHDADQDDDDGYGNDNDADDDDDGEDED
jgi:hypothetical protein